MSGYIKSGIRTFKNEKLALKDMEPEYSGCMKEEDEIYHDSINALRNTSCNGEHLGGAVKKVVAKKKKVETKPQPRYTSKTVNDIHMIGKAIVSELLKNNIYYVYSPGDDTKLMNYAVEYMQRNDHHLDRTEYEFLIRYLRENIYKNLIEGFQNKHSLASLSGVRLINDPQCGDNGSVGLRYSNKIAISRELSNNWTGLSNLIGYDGDYSVCRMDKNVIHPLFFMLFAVRIPGFEDMVIQSDYPSLVEEIREHEVQDENILLMLLRTMDPNPLRMKKVGSLAGNESTRISIAMLLREISLCVRTGIFESEASLQLENILCNFDMPGTKFPEENMYQALLSTFSYTPTLITRQTPSLLNPYNRDIALFEKHRIFAPAKSVYNVEYPISDMYTYSNNSIPHLDKQNIEYMGFDPVSNKVIFTYSSNKDIISNDQNNLLNNIYKTLTTEKIEVRPDQAMATLLARGPQLQSLYKDVQPVKILMSNGLCVTIPREQTKISTRPCSNFFFNSKIRPMLNLSPVLVSDYTTINGVNCELVAALCYDVFSEGQGFSNLDNVYTGAGMHHAQLSNKIGTYAIVKSGTRWFEYNPQDTLTVERKTKKMERMLTNRYNLAVENGENNSFEEWRQANLKNVNDSFRRKEFSVIDMMIPEAEALEKISTTACILIYAEDYDQYKNRIIEKYF